MLRPITSLRWSAWTALILITLSAPLSAQEKQSAGGSVAALREAREAAALEAKATARAAALGDLLNSPFCPGKTLSTCTSSQAFELRKEMQALIKEGKSDEEILARLRRAFDLMSLEAPPQPWYVMLVPILPFVFGGLLSLWFFARWRDPRRERANGKSADEGDSLGESERAGAEESARADRLDALLLEED